MRADVPFVSAQSQDVYRIGPLVSILSETLNGKQKWRARVNVSKRHPRYLDVDGMLQKREWGGKAKGLLHLDDVAICDGAAISIRHL